MKDMEKVGNVALDLTYYSGEDLYTDGDIEDELLDIVKNNAGGDFAQIIAEKKSWPIFYHLSEFRTNIIDWLPIKDTDKVLEIGSGCGAITGALARKARSVTCIDLSKKRSLVNAYKNKEYGNITIKVGNFKDIEPHLGDDFDYVMLIGVFEYGDAYIGGDTPYDDFMRICNRHRKLDGRLIIAIENKFGLKYWAGCSEDHLGTYFSGIEGYRGDGSVRTFTRNGLEKILERLGIGEYFFYYPYPDYKFMTTIYSDRYLPKEGELSNNLRNFDRERVLLFDEKQAFDEIIADEEFPLFSNSYLLVVGGAPKTLYAKFSNDRDRKWAIQTKIVRSMPGHVHVEKLPCSPAAYGHIENMQKAYELLSKRYEGTKIFINKCVPKDGDIRNGLVFEYCKGVTLESVLDECLHKSDVSGFKSLVREYMEWLRYGEGGSFAVSNIDFIFPNILVDIADGGKWHVIDYEWTYEEKIPAKDIAFRAFYNYLLGGGYRKSCEEFLMRDILGFSEDEIKAGALNEQKLQSRISADRVSVAGMRELIGNRAYEFAGMLSHCHYTDVKLVAQLYFDYGEGFSEENSVKLHDRYEEMQNLSIDYVLPQDIVRVRIDPCSYMCAAQIRNIKLDEKIYEAGDMEINGFWHPCGSIIFDSADPNITIGAKGGGRLCAEMKIFELPDTLAKSLASDIQKQEMEAKAKEAKAKELEAMKAKARELEAMKAKELEAMEAKAKELEDAEAEAMPSETASSETIASKIKGFIKQKIKG